jgi:uncharacterized membrane protein YgcG
MFARLPGIFQTPFIVLLVLIACYIPGEVSSLELPRLSGMVNDFPAFLQPQYAQELERRLKRFNAETGYAIVVVVVSSGEDKPMSKFIADIFSTNELHKWSLAGTVLVLITVKEGWVIAEPSQKIESKFLKPGALDSIRHFEESESDRQLAVESRVEKVVQILDPWFYVLDQPSDARLVSRFPTGEIILFGLAPYLGLMSGIVLIAFTAAGQLSILGRILVCAVVGCFIASAAAFVIRQPGGIVLGMVYYSGASGCVISALIGALKPYWFTDTVRGRKPGEWIHPPFHGRG